MHANTNTYTLTCLATLIHMNIHAHLPTYIHTYMCHRTNGLGYHEVSGNELMGLLVILSLVIILSFFCFFVTSPFVVFIIQ